jgi:ferritin
MITRPLKATQYVATDIATVKPVKAASNLISEDCVKYLNYRIEQEELSSRLYLAMSLWLNDSGYTNAAALWKKYSAEELSHADWAREYLLALGILPETPTLSAPQQTFNDLADIIYKSHEHEALITNQCKELASSAFKKGDHMLYQLALKYLHEQVEEMDKMQTWVDKLETFGTDKIALRFLENEMS